MTEYDSFLPRFQQKRTNPQLWVARWFVFEPNIPIWINFGGPCDRRCWYILWPFGLFDGHLAIFYGVLVYFMVSWYIFPVLASFIKKNLATLAASSICMYVCVYVPIQGRNICSTTVRQLFDNRSVVAKLWTIFSLENAFVSRVPKNVRITAQWTKAWVRIVVTRHID
jgi:hypothetical protein